MCRGGVRRASRLLRQRLWRLPWVRWFATRWARSCRSRCPPRLLCLAPQCPRASSAEGVPWQRTRRSPLPGPWPGALPLRPWRRLRPSLLLSCGTAVAFGARGRAWAAPSSRQRSDGLPLLRRPEQLWLTSRPRPRRSLTRPLRRWPRRKQEAERTRRRAELPPRRTRSRQLRLASSFPTWLRCCCRSRACCPSRPCPQPPHWQQASQLGSKSLPLWQGLTPLSWAGQLFRAARLLSFAPRRGSRTRSSARWRPRRATRQAGSAFFAGLSGARRSASRPWPCKTLSKLSRQPRPA
mmetsp:Transcript_2899/g.11751  ORF Transcript_2899/g.11751 Transcript_2899/m.11751 type:complete len:295 (+) Transcript_2899:4222-5106(+)